MTETHLTKTTTMFQKVDHQIQNLTLATTSLKLQKTNMVVCRDVFDETSEKIFFGEESLKNFLEFMLHENNGYNYCVAHNGSSYDTRLISEELSKMNLKSSVKATCNGTKFMELRVEKVVFIDSLLHLPGSLAGLAKSFGLELCKGTFPHLFNSPENYDYEGSIPPKEYFDLTFTAKSDRDIVEFNEWYEERSKTIWNFKTELTNYCKDDVLILSKLIVLHHEICFEKFKISPWFSVTAPSYCHKVIISKLSENLDLTNIKDLAWNEHWGVLKPQEYWFARDALIGGRTDVRMIEKILTPEEISRGVQIKYQDIVSMYPEVQAANLLEYPVGLPRIKIYDTNFYPCTKHQNPETGNVLTRCDCTYNGDFETRKFADRMIDVEVIQEQPSVDYIYNYNTFGIICVSMTPPTNLFHPVLLVWNKETGKRCATLEPLIEQTYTTIEVQRALSKGYILNKVHRLDLYNKKPGLWSDFVKELYIEKMVNSGPIPSVEEQERLVRSYEEKFGIGEQVRASFPRWAFRPALRLVYKIMLNSGWGKHCQRPIMPTKHFIHEGETMQMVKLFSHIDNNNDRLTNIQTQGKNQIITTFKKSFDPVPHDSYLPAGLFVPAYGRLRLYEQLDMLGDRVLYHDTDSIIYIYDPSLENIPEGDIWGDWDEESVSKNGNITGFIGIGAKSYALKTKNNKDVIKLKGLCIRNTHKNQINFETLLHLIRNRQEMDVPQRNFIYKMGEGIHIKESLKKLTFNPDSLKGFLHSDNKVYPPGYCKACLGLIETHTH